MELLPREAWVLAVDYLFAALIYTMLGRFVLGLFVPPEWDNYIWRFFRRVTDPVLAVARPADPELHGRRVPAAGGRLVAVRRAHPVQRRGRPDLSGQHPDRAAPDGHRAAVLAPGGIRSGAASMRDLEQAAVQSVARGVGFGTLAISLVVVGLAGYPTSGPEVGRGARRC